LRISIASISSLLQGRLKLRKIDIAVIGYIIIIVILAILHRYTIYDSFGGSTYIEMGRGKS
jgi:hypothetical protein